MIAETWAYAYWQTVVQKDGPALLPYFAKDAVICFHNTNEQFTPQEFVQANSSYPGRWACELEQITRTGSTVVTAVRVFGTPGSFHATSFFTLQGGLITRLDEYWGDDGSPPAWRQAMHIGKPIR